MDPETLKNRGLEAELHRSLDAAAAAARGDEPHAAAAQIEPTVRQMGGDAIRAWRNPGVPAGAARNTAWEAEFQHSLDAAAALVRELDPTATEGAVEALVRQGAQVALENWRIDG